ncbi:CBS domain-containing protein [Bowmanella denitrificans]|uniref:CBS domain-containing protein n=1 Tax=Bowmanella denitrificans TaxID=366582 RepID=A0ABN0XP33_9ALTE
MQVKDIMTSNLHTLTQSATLHDAHNMSREYGIRHIPIVDMLTGKYMAIVTQKALVARVMKLANLYGQDNLSEQEKLVPIMDVAIKDGDSATADQSLLEIAEYFVNYKHGCLPVVTAEGQLQGILTSSDFVKLAIKLLKQQ